MSRGRSSCKRKKKRGPSSKLSTKSRVEEVEVGANFLQGMDDDPENDGRRGRDRRVGYLR